MLLLFVGAYTFIVVMFVIWFLILTFTFLNSTTLSLYFIFVINAATFCPIFSSPVYGSEYFSLSISHLLSNIFLVKLVYLTYTSPSLLLFLLFFPILLQFLRSQKSFFLSPFVISFSLLCLSTSTGSIVSLLFSFYFNMLHPLPQCCHCSVSSVYFHFLHALLVCCL